MLPIETAINFDEDKYDDWIAQRVCGWCKQINPLSEIHFRVEADEVFRVRPLQRSIEVCGFKSQTNLGGTTGPLVLG